VVIQLIFDKIKKQIKFTFQKKWQDDMITRFFDFLTFIVFSPYILIYVYLNIYLSKQTFFLMKFNKSKYRSAMSDKHFESV
jgi:hypothetical protein